MLLKEIKEIIKITIIDIMPVNPIVINQKKDIEKTISIMDKKNCISMIPVVNNDGRIIEICSRSESKRIGQYLIIFS